MHNTWQNLSLYLSLHKSFQIPLAVSVCDSFTFHAALFYHIASFNNLAAYTFSKIQQ